MKKIILLIIFLFFFNAMLPASYKDALSLYEEKKYRESLATIARELDPKKDLESNSFNYDLRFLAAHNHWKTGNLQAAIGHFRRCAEIKKNSADPLIDLALMMLESKRYGDANYFAISALKISENQIPYYILGKSAMKLGNYYKAKEYFEKAISIDPEFWIAYNDLGIILIELRKFSEANTAFSAALSVMPGSAEIQNNIGMSLERMNKLDEALNYYNRAYEKNSANPVIQANIIRIKVKIAAVKRG